MIKKKYVLIYPFEFIINSVEERVGCSAPKSKTRDKEWGIAEGFIIDQHRTQRQFMKEVENTKV